MKDIKKMSKMHMIDILSKKFQYPVNEKRDRAFIRRILFRLNKQNPSVTW